MGNLELPEATPHSLVDLDNGTFLGVLEEKGNAILRAGMRSFFINTQTGTVVEVEESFVGRMRDSGTLSIDIPKTALGGINPPPEAGVVNLRNELPKNKETRIREHPSKPNEVSIIIPGAEQVPASRNSIRFIQQ
jgi:hypothetical protein